MVQLLPQLNHLDSLSFERKPRSAEDLPADLKSRVYQSALLNTGLQSLIIEPFFREDSQFKQDIQAICIRNKFRKAAISLKDGSLSFQTLPAILDEVQDDCHAIDLCPMQHNAKLIHAALCKHVQPETVVTMEDYFLAENS